MKVFLTGAVHRFPDYRERFAEAKAKLEAQGKQVVTPLDAYLWDEREFGTDAWYDIARRQVRALGGCEELWLLSNWRRSTMVQREIQPLAETLGMPIFEMEPGCDIYPPNTRPRPDDLERVRT